MLLTLITVLFPWCFSVCVLFFLFRFVQLGYWNGIWNCRKRLETICVWWAGLMHSRIWYVLPNNSVGMIVLGVSPHYCCIYVPGTFPIDTTKTRLQVQGQHNSLHTELRYRGMTHALVEISKHEGYRALYAGCV